MVVAFIIVGIIFALTIYLAFLYLVKCLLEFYNNVIDWKILRYLLTGITIALVVGLHLLIIGIIIAIL